MATGSTNILAVADRLKGRENYVEWKFQMTNLLKLDGLWNCIVGYPKDDETSAEKQLRQDEMALSKINLSIEKQVFTKQLRQDEMALSKINLSIEKQVFTYVTNSASAKDAWKALESAFEDKGLHRRLQTLRKLCSIKLKDFNSMQQYVNEAMTLSQQLTTMGKPIDDEFLGVIMLQGLPQEYEPMVMALENSLTEITSNFVKLKLLQDEKWNSKQIEEVNIPTNDVMEETTADSENLEHSVLDEENPSSEDSPEYAPSDGQDDHEAESSSQRYPQRLRKAKQYPDFVSYLCSSFEEPLCYEDAISSKSLQEKTRDLDRIRGTAEQNIINNQMTNEHHYNKKRNEPREYNAKDLVVIKNRDDTAGANKKLLPKYRGPYVVAKVWGPIPTEGDIEGFQLTQIPDETIIGPDQDTQKQTQFMRE
ncbi:hypothetical protein QE152_g8552 [Popillia japonica]|uniref:DUF4219 domain-containing protein n=1 Tax=Popillia japonica TaxID=7064 RepID=A0AAW1MBR7_POPJA